MNKLISKFLIAIAATVFTSSAFGSNWVELANNYYVDTQSVRRDGPITSAWIRANYDPDIKIARSWLGLMDVHCFKRELRIRYSVPYDLPNGQGKPVLPHEMNDPFTPIAPDTKGESLYQFLCTK